MRTDQTVFVLLALSVVLGQQVGTQTAERHPPLSLSICSNSSGCQTQSKSVVLDSNWRWAHTVSGYQNCYTGNSWNSQYCPDPQTCSKNCAIDGADYSGTYGVYSNGQSLSLQLVTQGPYSKNIGSRVYLFDESSQQYELFKLKNREFTFDADVSALPCGLNGALYFVQMPANGGKGLYPLNQAGAAYGTGYCDAQCPRDIKFINGEANVLNWTPSPDDPNSGTGLYGSCCAEMDIWEANSQATAYTAHPCTSATAQRCQGDQQCGDGSSRYSGFCDKDGCDFNSFRNGMKDFFGQDLRVDTRSPVTVVTQFYTADGTDGGQLSEIRRKYVQNGRVIYNTVVLVPNVKPYDSLSDAYCTDIKKAFGDQNDFANKGGMKGFSAALDKGMVLVMSLWDDYSAYMLWLDSNYPTDKNPLQPGIARGNCSTSSGRPKDVESQYPNAKVVFSNIRFGQIGSTTKV